MKKLLRRQSVIALLIAMVVSMAFVSCGNDDDPDDATGTDIYYLQLTKVVSNLASSDGQSLANALLQEWITINRADNQGRILLGKMTKKSAEEVFDVNISSMTDQFNDLYSGKNILPEGGFIEYHFALTDLGRIIKSDVIKVNNDGASTSFD